MLNALTSEKSNAQNTDDGAPVPAELKSGAFAKKLRWQIQNPDQIAEQWIITPAMAAEMLTWNSRNRPLSKARVRKYAAAMKAGRFKFTGQPIQFSNERLLDGQTRLAASVESGCAFEAVIMFGLPDDSFDCIDINGVRTAGDIFAIHGVKSSTLIAAAMHWIVLYERGTLGRGYSGGSSRLDHAALYDEFLQHSEVSDSAWVGRLFSKNRLASGSTMAAMHYLCARKSRSDADKFFRAVGEGIGFNGKRDPAYKLHSRLIKNATAQEKLNRAQVAALTVKAWRAVRLDRETGVLKFGSEETFPKVI